VSRVRALPTADQPGSSSYVGTSFGVPTYELSFASTQAQGGRARRAIVCGGATGFARRIEAPPHTFSAICMLRTSFTAQVRCTFLLATSLIRTVSSVSPAGSDQTQSYIQLVLGQDAAVASLPVSVVEILAQPREGTIDGRLG
jgi:hypothetical protein